MNEDRRDPFEDVENVVSAAECTGLMPVLPQTEAEDDNYAALYATHTGRKLRRMYRKK